MPTINHIHTAPQIDRLIDLYEAGEIDFKAFSTNANQVLFERANTLANSYRRVKQTETIVKGVLIVVGIFAAGYALNRIGSKL